MNLRTRRSRASFNQGAWLTFPVKVAAGETLTVTVTRTAGTNAVLSGIFLGEAGTPPAPTVASAPQGGWVGKVGSEAMTWPAGTVPPETSPTCPTRN